MLVKELIEERLTKEFSPQKLHVIDESHLHHGHSGWREGGQTHFRVEIVAEVFTGLSRLERHRRMNTALADAFTAGLHALALEVRAPNENSLRI